MSTSSGQTLPQVGAAAPPLALDERLWRQEPEGREGGGDRHGSAHRQDEEERDQAEPELAGEQLGRAHTLDAGLKQQLLPALPPAEPAAAGDASRRGRGHDEEQPQSEQQAKKRAHYELPVVAAPVLAVAGWPSRSARSNPA